MRPFGFLLGMLALALGIGSLATAQTSERPHMELVRALRANGMPDLALKYLDEIKAKGDKNSPEIAVLLNLEYARTWLDLAADENEEVKRTELIAKAKDRLTIFINSSKGHPLLPQANVELARLESLRGKAIIRKARKMDKEPKEKLEARNKKLKEGRDALLSAAEKYKTTVALLEPELKKLEKDPPPISQRRKELSQFLLKSMLDQAITLYDLGNSYDTKGTTKEVEDRGKQFQAAQKVFEKIMYIDDKEPLCWTARAWAAQCDYEIGEEEKARLAFVDLLKKQANPAAAAGVRVARYFGIFRSFDKDAKTEDERLANTEKAAAAWLNDYPTHRNTFEGLGARYYLGFMKYTIGRRNLLFDKDGKRILGFKNEDAKKRFDDAQKIFRDIAETDNEYTERANRFRSNILIASADAAGHGDAAPIESLRTFEVCYLMAQVQLARLAQFNVPTETTEEMPKKDEPSKLDPKKKDPPKKEEPPKKVEEKKEMKKEVEAASPAEAFAKEETRRYTNAMRYLERGLQLVSSKDPVRDVFNAQLFLMDCYRKLKLFPQAAILGEYVARNYPRLPKAPAAAQAAMQAYNIAYRRKPEPGKEAPVMPAADVARLRNAAQFLVTTFPTEAAADEARHILGFFLLREAREKADKDDQGKQRFEAAWRVYASIRDGYPAVCAARNELAGIMYNLVRPTDEKDPKILSQRVADNINFYSDPKSGAMWTTTIKLLEELTPPDEDCIIQDALAYLDGRQTLSFLYQLANQHDKALKAGQDMVKALDLFEEFNVKATDLTPEQLAARTDRRENYTNIARNVELSAARAAAYKLYKEDKNYAAVAEKLDPHIAVMPKEFAKPAPKEATPASRRLRDTQRAILILALQSSVQNAKIERAAELVELLDQSGNTVEDNQVMLRSLVANVRDQIKSLEEDNKTEDATKLKEGFTTLLDKISAKGEKLPVSMKMFIAQGYSSVSAFDNATKLLEEIRKIPAPPKPAPVAETASDAEVDKFKEAQALFENHEKLMRQVQFTLVRNYRAAKNYDAATKLLTEMIGPITPKVPVPPPAQRGWAFGAIEIRKEKALILEDVATALPKTATTKVTAWGNAVQEWVAIIRAFSPQLVPFAEVTADPKFQAPIVQGYIKKLVGENLKDQTEAQKALMAYLSKFTNPAIVTDTGIMLQQEIKDLPEERKTAIDERWKEIKKTVDDIRLKRSGDATATADKRARYFELYFEQKRCTVMAYSDLGLAAVKGVQADLDAKFVNLARDLHDLRTKNKDLSPALKERIEELFKKNQNLRAGFKALLASN